MFKPKSFPGQEPNEKIHLFLRRYWLSFLPSLLITFVMLLLPLVVFLGIKIAGITLGDFRNLAILGTSCYILFVLAFFITAFIDYYLDICIVTDRRIIDIDQRGLFNRQISEQNLIRVQDVTAKKKGIFQTFFDYGNVYVQTAGEAPNFEFMAIRKPNEVAQQILKLYHQIMAKGYREPEEKPPPPHRPPESPPAPSGVEGPPSEPPPSPLPPEKPQPPEPEKPQDVTEEELKKGGEINL